MKNLLTQIGIGIVMAVGVVIAVIGIVGVWLSVVIYQFMVWLLTTDGLSHNKSPIVDTPPVIEKERNRKLAAGLELDAQIDAAFSKKPLPKPYTPTDNPLYQLGREEGERYMADLKSKLLPFNRKEVFRMVDESNERMSNKPSGKVVGELTFKDIFTMTQSKAPYNVRDKKGRFTKRYETKKNTL
jgi:hypothetical protein